MATRVPEAQRGTLTSDATGHREGPVLLEPTPIHPRPRRTRWQAAAAAIVAVGVLGAVVVVGRLGPEPVPTASTEPSAASAATEPSPATEPAPAAEPAIPGVAEAPPRSRFGLDPTTVPDVLEARASGGDDGTRLVVVGWLSIRPGAADCLPSATSSAPACAEEGILAADPTPTLRWDDGRAVEVDPEAPHLRSIFPPGVDIPSADGAADTPGSPPTAGLLPARLVVLVGRFRASGTDSCRLGFLACGEPFVVEQVL
jgi:hypothetical protein